MYEFSDSDTFLGAGVAVAHGNGVFQFRLFPSECVEINDDARGGADFILTAVPLTNVAVVVPCDVTEFLFEHAEYLTRFFYKLWLVLQKW